MKAYWVTRKNNRREMRVMWAFLCALLFGGHIDPEHENPNQPGTLEGYSDDDLQLVVEQARIQMERQDGRYRHATDRSQVLLTVDLALLGFLAALLAHVLKLHGGLRDWALVLWALAALLGVVGTGVAAAVIAVKAPFTAIDATIVSAWNPPILKRLAQEYASAVRAGELTADLRVTAFQRATRIAVWAAVLAAIAFGLCAVKGCGLVP